MKGTTNRLPSSATLLARGAHLRFDGDAITTNQTSFCPTLGGASVDVTTGPNARLTDSIFLYRQYEYENADKRPHSRCG